MCTWIILAFIPTCLREVDAVQLPVDDAEAVDFNPTCVR